MGEAHVSDQEHFLLSYWEWHSVFSGDILQNQIRKIDETSWEQLGENFESSSGAWVNRIEDISAYAGSTIQLSFFQNEDGSAYNYGTQYIEEGLYIDDIEIRIEPPREIDIPTEAIPWKQMALGGPAPRRDASTIFDSLHNKIFLFGGRNDTENFGDSWAWAGAGDTPRWSQITATGPSPRFGAAMGYDTVRDRVVLFGGSSGPRLGDTWEWDGTQWIDVTPTISPNRRANAAMAYDKTRQRMVLFGGMDGLTRLGDTWEWDGTAWTQTASDGPSSRAECGMAYDEERLKIVLFGGRDTVNYYDDTWVYDGTSWQKLSSAESPSARTAQSSLTYDTQRKRIVLYGGSSESGVLGDTWEYDGTEWFNTANTGPYPRTGGAIAYDSSRERTVLFGGTNPFENATVLGDTWEYYAGDILPALWCSPLNSSSEFVSIPGGFDNYPAGIITVGTFPEEIGPFSTNNTDGNGVIFDMDRGQVYLLMFPTVQVGDSTVLIRASVRASAPGAAIALAALDPSDNSVGTYIPSNSEIFSSEFKSMTMIFDPPSGQVSPIFQVSNIGNIEPVTVYMDNIEVIRLPREKNRRIYGE